MIRIENLTRLFGKRVAVDNISFHVEKGEIIGFLGPNGAGKTTTMRIITGFLMPTSGEVSVAGYDMTTSSLEARRHIGYMPEVVPLYTDMTTRQYLAFTARLRGMDRRQTADRIAAVVNVCHLEEYIDVIIGKLSKGFRQRVGMAQAIIHDPAVLILDEPTVGIDPRQVAETRDLIRGLGRERTVLLSTHILPEVSMICERVIIIHKGQIVAEDRIENLSALIKGGERVRLHVQGPSGEVLERLSRIAGVRGVTYQAPYHFVEFTADSEPQARIVRAVVEADWTLLAMETVHMSLEDIFLEVTGKREKES